MVNLGEYTIHGSYGFGPNLGESKNQNCEAWVFFHGAVSMDFPHKIALEHLQNLLFCWICNQKTLE